MIARSRSILAAAVVGAAGLHLVGIVTIFASPSVKIAAGGASVDVKQGSAFADMATGIMTPVSPAEITEVPRPEPIQPEQTQPVEATEVTPEKAARVEPAEATVVEPVEAQPPRDVTSVQSSVVPNDAVAIFPGVTAVFATPKETVSATVVQPVPTPKVAAVKPLETAPAPQTLTAQELPPSTVLSSVRPAMRPESLAPPPPKPEPVRRQPEPAATPRGNANQNAAGGSQASTNQQATATVSGSNAQEPAASVQANSREVSNYPGLVMRRLSRVRRPRTNSRGSALVSFSIVANGGLGAVSIARSSGDAKLDQLALQFVQRAAPFPAPPSGAQTRYTIEVSGS